MCVYDGHRDGVWEVSHARNGLPVIGTASAGMKLTMMFFTIFSLCVYIHTYMYVHVCNNFIWELRL